MEPFLFLMLSARWISRSEHTGSRLAAITVHRLRIIRRADAAEVLLVASMARLAPRAQGPHLVLHDLGKVFVASALGSHGCSAARV